MCELLLVLIIIRIMIIIHCRYVGCDPWNHNCYTHGVFSVEVIVVMMVEMEELVIRLVWIEEMPVTDKWYP